MGDCQLVSKIDELQINLDQSQLFETETGPWTTAVVWGGLYYNKVKQNKKCND